MSYPKNQCKAATSGEGPRGTMGSQGGDAGKSGHCESLGKDYEIDARHTAAWMDGAKLTVKREG